MLTPAHRASEGRNSEGRTLVPTRMAGAGLCVIAFMACLDGVDALLTRGHGVSWWWQWTGADGGRIISGRHGRGLGISAGLPTFLFGITESCFAITLVSVVTLRWRDRRVLKVLAGIAVVIGLGAALAAGVLSFAM